jgi:hypothetical protein
VGAVHPIHAWVSARLPVCLCAAVSPSSSLYAPTSFIAAQLPHPAGGGGVSDLIACMFHAQCLEHAYRSSPVWKHSATMLPHATCATTVHTCSNSVASALGS